MTESRWTMEPPTKPGYYWFRYWTPKGQLRDIPRVTQIKEDFKMWTYGPDVEWWPVPIEEPPW